MHKQWNLYNAQNEGYDINVSPAWNYATGRGVKIAIVDGDGVDIMHPDLVENADSALSYDAVLNVKPNVVRGAHGTHCAGIAAAVRNNGKLVAGVAPDAKLMTVSMQFDGTTVASAINWAWRHGADVISCSWRVSADDKIKEALDSAIVRGRNGKGCVIIKSAGNSYGPITWPGDYCENILAVAAIDWHGNVARYSSYGDNMFVAAPGDSILSTIPDDSITKMSGTSMAAPHVAGVVALVLERNPNLTVRQMREIIARTARKVCTNIKEYTDENYEIGETYRYDTVKEFGTWNKYTGYGLVDAYKAVLNTPRE